MPELTNNPLHDFHRQAEAEFQPYGDVEIVSTFGEPQAEYAAIRKGCGLMDLPQRGVIELSGKDRLPFLNNLLTNQTYDKNTKTPLAVGKTVYAFLLNAKTGRILVDLNVIERGDATLLEMDSRLVDSIVKSLENYHFGEQLKITSKLGTLHEFALHGPTAHQILGISELPANESIAVDDRIIWRDDPAGVPGYHILQPIESARKMWVELISSQKARPIGWAAFNTARIEAGRPLFGIDFDDSILPAETGQLGRAVSFTKGCYPGQEIIARMHARAQLAKQIVGIRMDDEALPIAGAVCQDEQGNAVGGITSSTMSPLLSNAAIGLALLKKPFYEIGKKVKIPAEGSMRTGTVTPLPFVRL